MRSNLIIGNEAQEKYIILGGLEINYHERFIVCLSFWVR